MTELEENILLRNILLEAAMADYAAELADHRPEPMSARLQRQMNAMLNDPNVWAKRLHRSIWSKVARAAAMILLAFSLSLGALMAVSPTIRAAIINWVVEWYDTQIVYRFSGRPADNSFAPLPRYEVTALPEGYRPFKDEIVTPDSYDIGYVNEDGELFWFGYQRMEQGSVLAIQEDTEGMTADEVTVNGCKGWVYCSQDAEPYNIVVWIDEKQNLEFDISGFFSRDELLHIAESVSLCNSTK